MPSSCGWRSRLSSGVMAAVAVATSASGQNLVFNGSFEVTSVAGPVNGCCELVESLPAGASAVPGWSVDGGGAELRGRDAECVEGPADGGRWLRLGQGFTGGSITQLVPTRPAVRHAIRFRRWVESPTGVMVPLNITAPGFNVPLFLPPDGPSCTPQIAASTIVRCVHAWLFECLPGRTRERVLYLRATGAVGIDSRARTRVRVRAAHAHAHTRTIARTQQTCVLRNGGVAVESCLNPRPQAYSRIPQSLTYPIA